MYSDEENDMALVNDFGESKVTVDKAALLKAVMDNRAKHAKEYEEALAGYHVELVQTLTDMLAKAKDEDLEDTLIKLAKPTDHTKDYDRVIRMLEMSTADQWTISEQQFSQYVLDEWSWMGGFKALSHRYMNSNRG